MWSGYKVAVEENERFPSKSQVALALRGLPNVLGFDGEFEYAGRIDVFNDLGLFSSAWKALAEALGARPVRYHPLTEHLKEHYPYPVSGLFTQNKDEKHSVGGALMMHLFPRQRNEESIRFPQVEELALALKRINKNLKKSIALSYAKAIVYFNDYFNFASAWKALDDAISYARNETEPPHGEGRVEK